VLVVSCRHKCRSHQKLGKLVEFLHGGVLRLDCCSLSAFCLPHVAICLARHGVELCGNLGDFSAADVLADNPTIFASSLPVVLVVLIPAHFVLHLRQCPASELTRLWRAPLPVGATAGEGVIAAT
jgi:hypothetical protein